MIDWSTDLYDSAYAVLGVPATLTAGTAGEVTLTVVDKTRPKTNTGGSAEVISIGPSACVRVPELTDNGIGREELVDAVLTFNGRSWKVLASEHSSPNGEDGGELRLLLKASNG